MSMVNTSQFYKFLGATRQKTNFSVDLDCYTLGYVCAAGDLKKIPIKSAITKSFALGFLDKSSNKKFRFDVDKDYLNSFIDRTVKEVKEYESMLPQQRFWYVVAVSATVFFLWFLNKTRKTVGVI